MNHDEYLSQLELESDANASAVLAHVASCAACRREQRAAGRALARLEPREASRFEEIARIAAVAAVVAIVVLGLRGGAAPKAAPETPPRYRIVGDASGVVAYTPTGTLVSSSAPRGEKESVR